MYRLIAVVLYPVLRISVLCAADLDAEQRESWTNSLATKSVQEIGVLMGESSDRPWPHAGSRAFIEAAEGAERKAASDSVRLVEQLREKIRNECLRYSRNTANDVGALSVISAALDRAGGYSNRLLADSIRELALFRLSEDLVVRGVPPAVVRPLAEKITVPRVDVRVLLEEFAADDKFVADHADQIRAIKPDRNIFVSLAEIGVVDPIAAAGRSYSQLCADGSAPALVVRMARTEALYSVSLKGLLVFLERGGKFAELNPGDTRAFKQRMGGREREFMYRLYGIRSLQGSSIRYLFELHKDEEARAAFLKNILE